MISLGLVWIFQKTNKDEYRIDLYSSQPCPAGTVPIRQGQGQGQPTFTYIIIVTCI